MKKIASFIVKFRYVILSLLLVFAGFCAYGYTKTKIEYSIESYLPQETDTKKALDIMEKEFYTFGSTSVMIKNISVEEAQEIVYKIDEVEGVKDTQFKNNPSYYTDGCAKIKITFAEDDESEVTKKAFHNVKEIIKDYEYYFTTDYEDDYAESLNQSVFVVLIVVIIIIIGVLLLTCTSLMEVPVFLLTFGLAALMNGGTNFLLGTISFVSNSVCIVLQLALAIDYAIILSGRYQEEKKFARNNKDALVSALTKAIPEIVSSSLTTISGLLVLTTMSLRLGADLGIVLSKSILFSMVAVFLFMPIMLLIFDKPITKTTHKNLVPKVSFIGKFAVKTSKVTPILFILIAIGTAFLNLRIDYCYDMVSVDSIHLSNSQKSNREITNVFGHDNQFAVVLEGNDTDMQKEVLDIIASEDNVSEVQGIANTEVTLNNITHFLTEKINCYEFSEFLALDQQTAETIYTIYAGLSKDNTTDSVEEIAIFQIDKTNYKVSLLNILDLAFEHDELVTSSIRYNDDLSERYEDIKTQIQDAEKQLIGPNYSRVVFNIDSSLEGDQTFNLIKKLESQIKAKYPGSIFAGASMSNYDLNKSFSADNLKITLLTILFVGIILLFTFKNYLIPIPLILAIQGAIFINFSWYILVSSNLYFFVSLIVSAIQMGATIDYAIVITNRYLTLRKTNEDKNKVIIQSINESFPTILTSGTILLFASLLIGIIVKDPLVSSLGFCLFRGVIVSILSALFVMPSMLLILDKFIAKSNINIDFNKIKQKMKISLLKKKEERRISKLKKIEEDRKLLEGSNEI